MKLITLSSLAFLELVASAPYSGSTIVNKNRRSAGRLERRDELSQPAATLGGYLGGYAISGLLGGIGNAIGGGAQGYANLVNGKANTAQASEHFNRKMAFDEDQAERARVEKTQAKQLNS